MRYKDLFDRCSIHLENSEYQQAYELIPSMRKIFYHKQLYAYYALLCWKAKKYDDMLKYALEGIKIMSKNTDIGLDKYCFFSAGIVYGKQRNVNKSLEYLKISTEMDPENSMFRNAYEEILAIHNSYEALFTEFDMYA